MDMSVSPGWMYVYRVTVWGLWQSEIIEFPGTRVKGMRHQVRAENWTGFLSRATNTLNHGAVSLATPFPTFFFFFWTQVQAFRLALNLLNSQGWLWTPDPL